MVVVSHITFSVNVLQHDVKPITVNFQFRKVKTNSWIDNATIVHADNMWYDHEHGIWTSNKLKNREGRAV